MTSRRNFLQKGLIAGAAMPALLSAQPTGSIDDLRKNNIPDDDYWKLVRSQFLLKEGQTYFNNGTMGPTPAYVINKINDHMMHNNIHAAEVDYKDGSGPALLTGYFGYEDIRKKIGAIINADYKSIALTQNATFGMNYVANGLELKKGDELINTDQEHGGGFAAWQQLAKRKGCVYKQAKMPVPVNDPQEIVDAVFAQVTKKTKVIAIPHIVSVYGTVMPVKKICAEARNRGIFTILDGAQCVGQIPVDVEEIGCDAYYSSLHKWMLAPPGNGILYINPDRIADIWCTIASYRWEDTDDHGFRLMQNGTGNPALMAGLEASVDFFNTIGQEKWLNRVKQLGDHLRTGLQELENVEIVSSTNPLMNAGITTYKVNGLSGPELQKTLWEKGRFQPRSVGQELLRHSTHIYNSEQEIDTCLEIISQI